MIHYATTLGRNARRIAILVAPIVVGTTGTAAAHSGGGYGGGMMGGGGWGFFGAGMGLWGLLLMAMLILLPLYLVFTLAKRWGTGPNERPLSTLRARYARGELSDDEFERRRKQLEQSR